MQAGGTIHESPTTPSRANGITLSPDGGQLYVNESVAGR